MSTLKKILNKITPPIFLDSAKLLQKKFQNGEVSYSNFDEEKVIAKHLAQLGITDTFCVDIAASDGVTMSNTYALFKSGWQGIAVEFNPIKFSILANVYQQFENAYLVKTKVTPQNVTSILDSCNCPKNFGFLNLDIDSYDYFVLDSLLSVYRPQLICLEINEKIPPPFSFSVTYSEDHFWQEDHFYGQSICMSNKLCLKHNYQIVELHYNNLFIVPQEINKFKALSPEEAYESGYKSKSDREQRFPYNGDMNVLLNMNKEEGIEFIRAKFTKYSGKYFLE